MSAAAPRREAARGAASRPRRPLDADGFREIVGVSRETCDRLAVYVELLLRWQRRINLIGPGTVGDVWRRHILDCAQLARHVPDRAAVITDLGSGAGLPGLVLAVMLGRETRLIESNARKCAFLREAARLTGAPAEIHCARIEALAPWPSDIVCARAVAPLDRLLAYAHPFLASDPGREPVCLFLKGARVERELTAARDRWHMEVDRSASITDDAGVVLRIRGVSRG